MSQGKDNQDNYQPGTMEDVEAEDELFGEVIEQSDAHIDAVNVMAKSDLSESSSGHASSIHLPKRSSNHAGVSDSDRATAAPATESSSMSGLWLTLLLVALVGGGLFLLTMGDPAPPENAVAAGDETPTKTGVTQIPEESDEGRGDGTPTLDVATLTKGMVAAGWRVGPPSVTTIDEVKQTNVLANKDAMGATVTIYESRTWDWANKMLLETEPPSRAVSFGRTIVRVSPGPPEQQSGIMELYTALGSFKKAARAQATGQPEKSGEEPASE